MPSLLPPPPPSPQAPQTLLGHAVAQAASVSAARARFLMGGSSAGAGLSGLSAGLSADLDAADADDALLPPLARSLSSASSASAAASASGGRHAHGAHCDSCAELETDFAAAVLFVESYQGPHRVLTQEASTPKKDFYAWYQQATLGPCPTSSPPPGASKLDISKWEKWKNLGAMTRQEAMKRYTTALDNLVDDWRRSANLRSSTVSLASTSSALTDIGVSPARPRKSTSLFERLPRVYEELGELQDRVEDEAKKREELEAHVLTFTRDQRELFSRELQRVDDLRESLSSLLRTTEDDVVQHYNELQQVSRRQHDLQSRVSGSLVLAAEARVLQAVERVRGWLRNRTLRAVLLALVAARVWAALRRRGLPQMMAQLLIRWLAKVSSLDSPPPSRALPSSAGGRA